MSRIIYDVYQNKNENNAAYGKYFGRIVHTETLNTRNLAKHISEHGSVYTQDVVEGVLTKAESCILEMLLESKKVKLEGLGTFYLMAENKKGGAISIDKFNPRSTFSGLHIRFLPDLSGEAQLNSKDMLQKATFMWAEDLKREKAESRPASPTNGGGTGTVDNSGSNGGSQDSGSQNGGDSGGGGDDGDDLN
jgi:predicted histone-like DNA-binding protein